MRLFARSGRSPLDFRKRIWTNLCGRSGRVRVNHMMSALLLIVSFYVSVLFLLHVQRQLHSYEEIAQKPHHLPQKQPALKIRAKFQLQLANSHRTANSEPIVQSNWTTMTSIPLREQLSSIISSGDGRITTISPFSLSKPTNDGTVLLLPSLVGRLGNQMFSWSAAWGLARQLSHAFAGKLVVRSVIPKESQLYRVFGAHLDGLAESEEELESYQWKKIKEKNALHDPRMLQLLVKYVRKDRRKLFKLCCYQQSWQYFHSSAAAPELDFDVFSLLRQFTFPPDVQSVASEYIRALRQRVETSYFNNSQSMFNQRFVGLELNTSAVPTTDWPTLSNTTHSADNHVVYVAVHIRLTDHRETQQSKIPNHEFYMMAASHFFKYSRYVHFVIASDDIESAHIIFPQELQRFASFVEIGERAANLDEAAVDLAVLSLCCNHSMLSVGSYGWWAAFLRERRRLAAARWKPAQLQNLMSLDHTQVEMAAGTTIYLSDFCEPNSYCYSEYYSLADIRTYFLPYWRPLSNPEKQSTLMLSSSTGATSAAVQCSTQQTRTSVPPMTGSSRSSGASQNASIARSQQLKV